MPICVPIKDLKHTAEFVDKVNSSDAVIVTRNGYDVFAAVPMAEYNAFAAERSRRARAEAELIASIERVEADIAAGNVIDGDTFMQETRDLCGM